MSLESKVNTMKRNFWIVILLVVALLILISGIVLLTTNKDEKNGVTSLSSEDKANLLQDLSGVDEPELTVDEKEKYRQIAALKKRLPLTEHGFEISYDYKLDMYVVDFGFESNLSEQEFWSWISDQGYSLIPRDSFLVK